MADVQHRTMSAQSGFQVSGRAAELYEQYPARYLLGPWAPGLVALASLQSGERVLDLACGTGVVARLAAARVELGQVTGVDINAGMLAVARALSTPPGAAITWVEASAAATGLPDDSFDVVLCQQGLQFFPDKSTALREVRRVLMSGGRALFSTWKSMGPYHPAVGDALERFLGVEVATKFRSTRVGLPDDVTLRRLFIDAGFGEVQVRSSMMVVHLPAIDTVALGALAGPPAA